MHGKYLNICVFLKPLISLAVQKPSQDTQCTLLSGGDEMTTSGRGLFLSVKILFLRVASFATAVFDGEAEHC